LLKPDATIQNYDQSDDSFFNLHYSGNYLYKVENSQIKCLTCPADENEYNDIDINETENVTANDSVVTTTVKVNGETVIVNQTGIKKGLSKDKNGVIIKNE
jgi:hypothetical protein